MIITKELVDIICPNHERSGCNDEYPINSDFDIGEMTFKGIVIERKLNRGPECKRCFLLDNIGIDVEELYRIKIKPTIELELIQPDVEVIIKEKKKE